MSNDTERLFWESINDSTDKADFDAYLRQFPTGVFAALARNRIATIVATEQAVSPPAPSSVAPERTETALVVRPVPALSIGERREAQIALRRLGLYRGAIDGLFGPGTRAGVVAFQRSIGVTANGRLTEPQLARLRQEAAAVTTLAAETVAAGTPAVESPAVDSRPPESETSPQIAVLPPPVAAGSFGAIAISRTPNPVDRGLCKNLPTQDAADACALSQCGVNCEIRAQFGAGQCGAFVESRERGGGEGFGVGDSWNDAVEGAKIGCFAEAGRNYTCELIASTCNE